MNSLTSRIDRRTHVRRAIDLPVDVTADGVTYVARSCNLSLEGLAVIVDGIPSISKGQHLQFGVELRYVDSMPMRLEGFAVVLRVDSCDGGALVALRAKWMGTSHISSESSISMLVSQGTLCEQS